MSDDFYEDADMVWPIPRSQPKPAEAQDARIIVENLQSALVIDGGRATAGMPWSVLLGNLLQWIETGQQKAFQRGQQAMAEKAAQHTQEHWYDPDVTATGMAQSIRSRAGAEPQPDLNQQEWLEQNGIVEPAVEPPQDKLRELVAKWAHNHLNPLEGRVFNSHCHRCQVEQLLSRDSVGTGT